MEASLAAGVTLFDTAEMYGAGASERRLGELTHGKDVLHRHEVPAEHSFRVWTPAERA